MLLFMKTAQAIVLTPEEAQTLDSWAASRTLPQRVVQRARLVRMAADGMQSQEIAKRLDVSRPTVQLWRDRFLALRLPGLEKDAPRPGRIPQISTRKVAAIVNATLQTTPANATHWSTRTMAEAQGVSAATVRRIWRGHRLKPHLVETFKLSRDKQFVKSSATWSGSTSIPPTGRSSFAWTRKARSRRLTARSRCFPCAPASRRGRLRLRAPRYDHALRRPEHARRQRHRRLHAAPPPSGVHPFPQAHRRTDPVQP